jgi:hypothetical protein
MLYRIAIAGSLVALLSACASVTQSTTAPNRSEPDCSFRSPTTCWTMSGRFPPQRVEPVERIPEPQPVLATGADSVHRRP